MDTNFKMVYSSAIISKFKLLMKNMQVYLLPSIGIEPIYLM